MPADIREFLRRVLPWPTDDQLGFVNVHSMCHLSDGKKPWTGSPTRNVDQFLSQVRWYQSWTTPPDVYMCMSRQQYDRPGKNDSDRRRAAKSQEHALALKAIYLDIDCYKAPPKGYLSLSDAVAAVQSFVSVVGIPAPTAFVASGGGLHVYWINDQELTPDEWKPYAEGLKHAAQLHGLHCDLGVTGDAARVLRVPGTFNYKQKLPRAVVLKGLAANDIHFAQALAALTSLAPSVPHPQAPQFRGSPSRLFAVLSLDSLSKGLDREQLPPLDWAPLIKPGGCPHFREALVTGGAGYSQGLWNLDVLMTTFLENGHALAHRVSRGHASYQRNDTEALWDRKNTERTSLHLGWPSCKAIQSEGCSSCAGCPHLVAGKSPLNLARVPDSVVQASAVASLVVPGSGGTSLDGTRRLIPVTNVDLPTGYVLNKNNRICKLEYVGKKGSDDKEPVTLPLFGFPVFTPWTQSEPDALNFTIQVDAKPRYHDVCILRKEMPECKKALSDRSVSYVVPQFKFMEDFLMSWLTKLNEAAAANTNVPFGWHVADDGTPIGFSYGGVLHHADGSRGPIGTIDPQLKGMYTPCGEVEPWEKSFRLVLDQKRPGLEAIVAMSFGSPLMRFTGEYVGMASVWSPRSGAFKSSAMKVALAVWGSPKLTKENEGATEKSVYYTLGKIRNLPFMWDEIKEREDQAKVYNLLYRSGGKDNSRLKQDITLRERGEWENMICIAANRSFVDYIAGRNPDTEAGLVRVFEWMEAPPEKHAIGVISQGTASRLLRELDDNYGQMGMKWAAWMASNYTICQETVIKESQFFETQLDEPDISGSVERFWNSFCAATMAGAVLANAYLGLEFDLDALRAFLVEKYKEQRRTKQAENSEGGSYEWTESLLTAFLGAYLKHTLITGPGLRPGEIALVSTPEPGCPTKVRWARETNELLFSQRALRSFLQREDVNSEFSTMRKGLRDHFGNSFSRDKLVTGTVLPGGPDTVGHIPIVQNGVLWAQLQGLIHDKVRVGQSNGDDHIEGKPGLLRSSVPADPEQTITAAVARDREQSQEPTT